MWMLEMKLYIDVFLSWKDRGLSPVIQVVPVRLTLTATTPPKRDKQHLYSIFSRAKTENPRKGLYIKVDRKMYFFYKNLKGKG